MATVFPIRIYSPAGLFFEGESTSLTFPTEDGRIGVLANHINMVAVLSKGTMTIRKKDDSVLKASVISGLVKVERGEVYILADRIMEA